MGSMLLTQAQEWANHAAHVNSASNKLRQDCVGDKEYVYQALRDAAAALSTTRPCMCIRCCAVWMLCGGKVQGPAFGTRSCSVYIQLFSMQLQQHTRSACSQRAAARPAALLRPVAPRCVFQSAQQKNVAAAARFVCQASATVSSPQLQRQGRRG